MVKRGISLNQWVEIFCAPELINVIYAVSIHIERLAESNLPNTKKIRLILILRA